MIPFLEKKLSFTQLVALLYIPNKRGLRPIQNLLLRVKYEDSFFDKLPPEKLTDFFSIQDDHGETPLHYSLITCVDLLEKLSSDELKYVLSIVDKEGNTPLHKPSFLTAAHPLLSKHNLDFSHSLNHLGLNIFDMSHWKSSESWFTKPKYEARLGAEVIKEQAYSQRIEILKADIQALWESAKDHLESHSYLREVKEKVYTSKEILTTLQEMVELMKDKKAWLGTPKKKEKALLDAFYCEMLINFETIAQKLKEKKNVQQTAGYLVSLASSRLEGRCAAAYQAEIEQKALLISEKMDQLSLDKIFHNAAYVTLQKVIDEIVGKLFNGDVHAMRQLRYAVGLVPNPDPLSQITLEEAQDEVLTNWNFYEILKEYKRNVPEEPELAIDWLKAQTPKDFGREEYDLLYKKMVFMEASLIAVSRTRLEKKIAPDKVTKVLEFLHSFCGEPLIYQAQTSNLDLAKPPGYGINSKSGKKEQLFDAVIDDEFRGLEKILPAEILTQLASLAKKAIFSKTQFINEFAAEEQKLTIEENKKLTAEELKKLTTEELIYLKVRKQITKDLSFQIQQLMRKAVYAIPKKLEALVTFHAAMDTLKLDEDQRLLVLQVKENHDKKLIQLGTQLSESKLALSFNLHKDRLPSLALNNARCLAYSQLSPVDEKSLLRDDDPGRHSKILIRILKIIGVLS